MTAHVADSEYGGDTTCTRVARLEQHLLAPASAPAHTPAPVPAPAADHAQASRGAQVEPRAQLSCQLLYLTSFGCW